LPRLERKRKQALEATFETAKYYAIKHESGNFPALSLLFNVSPYLLLAARDILRRLRIFGQQDKLRADRSKGRETWA
jgi:hypothetical protein